QRGPRHRIPPAAGRRRWVRVVLPRVPRARASGRDPVAKHRARPAAAVREVLRRRIAAQVSLVRRAASWPRIRGMIDIHSHVFPRITREEAHRAHARAPWLADHGDGSGHIMQGDAKFRPVESRLWDPAARLRWMDETGIAMQFVCATPVMFGYGWEVARAAAWAARMNDRMLEFCAADPLRLKALAQVPLQ